MKSNLFTTIAAGTTALVLISATVTNSFGEDRRRDTKRVDTRVVTRNGKRNQNQSVKVYTYRSNGANNNNNNHGSQKHQSYQNHRNHDQRIVHRGREYIYRDNCFYHRDRGGRLVVATAPIGAVVVSLPRLFHTVTIGNASVFFSGGIYYRKCHSGYEVIERPHFHQPPVHARRVIIREREYYVHNNVYYYKEGSDYVVCEPPEQVVVQQSSSSDVTIMVNNSNGSRTPVTLSPIGGNQWKGPRGEIYNGIPDNQQLSSAYGF